MNLAATHYRRCPLRPSLHTFVFISLVILTNKVVGAPPEVHGTTMEAHHKNGNFMEVRPIST
jgi:hypothetical protein